MNRALGLDTGDGGYVSVIGARDGEGRVVVGPLTVEVDSWRLGSHAASRAKVAPLPAHLQGAHVTLFGPPDSARMAANAMNCLSRRLPGEPALVAELVARSGQLPKWGADCEDSKTPLRGAFLAAGEHLKACFDGTLPGLEADRATLARPIKRFPGLALPSTSVFVDGKPVPLHAYDFVLHMHANWATPEALTFYVPKLENEEEARYVASMIGSAERRIKAEHPEYQLGTVRLFIVLENPRAVFRVHEIMDALYPYFAGASLGWHDYLASTARLFKEDPNYRIPVKADPDIVIKHIKESHLLLADCVGPRGGLKIGGMYGILPLSRDLADLSMQATIYGYVRDVVTQLRRGLDGFWVAHPDFVRIGIALVQAFREGPAVLGSLIGALILDPAEAETLRAFCAAPDVAGLDPRDPLYLRALLAAEKPARDSIISNSDPKEIRYNVFQAVQYIADWLSGNGCVALPATVRGQSVRVMDDLATTERSRWEVWAEIHHGRFPLPEYLAIVREELLKVQWPAGLAEKWRRVAARVLLKLTTDSLPVEFATELLMPFTVDAIRDAEDPWAEAARLCPGKFDVEAERLADPPPVPDLGAVEAALVDRPAVVVGAVRASETLRETAASVVHGTDAWKAAGARASVSASPLAPSQAPVLAPAMVNMVVVAFALQCGGLGGKALDARVVDLLERAGHAPGAVLAAGPSAGLVTVRHLLSWTALDRATQEGAPQTAAARPGREFVYAFKEAHAVLLALLRPALGSLGPWLESLGVPAGQFDLASNKMSPHATAVFLAALAAACADLRAEAPLHHAVALAMCHGAPECGSHAFNGGATGLGLFVGECGMNRVAFRHDPTGAIAMVCVNGPDSGRGFVLSPREQGDRYAVLAAALAVLRSRPWFGFHGDRAGSDPRPASVTCPAKLCRFLLTVCMDSDLPETTVETHPWVTFTRDPLAPFNKAVGATVASVTSQRFARAENLVSPNVPVFDVGTFGRMGKIMDSWESARHNARREGLGYDCGIWKLAAPAATVDCALVSTMWHSGNQAEQTRLDLLLEDGSWVTAVGRTRLLGHAVHRFRFPAASGVVAFRLLNIPDGGISRVGLFALAELPPAEAALFASTAPVLDAGAPLPYATPCPEPIPHPAPGGMASGAACPILPLPLPAAAVRANWARVSSELVDVASSLFGGSVTFASNQRYGPASACIAPWRPRGMFDGFESARSRQDGHVDYVAVHLGRPARLSAIEVDLSFFVNNSPYSLSIVGWDHTHRRWIPLVDQAPGKIFAGNSARFACDPTQAVISKLTVISEPDGGINRVRAIAKRSDIAEDLPEQDQLDAELARLFSKM